MNGDNSPSKFRLFVYAVVLVLLGGIIIREVIRSLPEDKDINLLAIVLPLIGIVGLTYIFYRDVIKGS